MCLREESGRGGHSVDKINNRTEEEAFYPFDRVQLFQAHQSAFLSHSSSFFTRAGAAACSWWPNVRRRGRKGDCLIHLSGSRPLPHTTTTSGIFLPQYSQQRLTPFIPSRGIFDQLPPAWLPQLNSSLHPPPPLPFAFPLPGLTFSSIPAHLSSSLAHPCFLPSSVTCYLSFVLCCYCLLLTFILLAHSHFFSSPLYLFQPSSLFFMTPLTPL